MTYQLPKARSPWAYFLPTALAVAAGVLLADLVRLLVIAGGIAAAVQGLGKPALRPATTPGDLPARPGLLEPPQRSAQAHRLEYWYEPEIARYRGQSRACVPSQGVQEWRDGRWQTVRLAGRPVPCRQLQ